MLILFHWLMRLGQPLAQGLHGSIIGCCLFSCCNLCNLMCAFSLEKAEVQLHQSQVQRLGLSQQKVDQLGFKWQTRFQATVMPLYMLFTGVPALSRLQLVADFYCSLANYIHLFIWFTMLNLTTCWFIRNKSHVNLKPAIVCFTISFTNQINMQTACLDIQPALVLYASGNDNHRAFMNACNLIQMDQR